MKTPKAALIVTEISGGYNVQSGDHNYIVTIDHPEFMNEHVRTFSCSCPAAQYGRGLCKHAHAVIDFIDNINDQYENHVMAFINGEES